MREIQVSRLGKSKIRGERFKKESMKMNKVCDQGSATDLGGTEQAKEGEQNVIGSWEKKGKWASKGDGTSKNIQHRSLRKNATEEVWQLVAEDCIRKEGGKTTLVSPSTGKTLELPGPAIQRGLNTTFVTLR